MQFGAHALLALLLAGLVPRFAPCCQRRLFALALYAGCLFPDCMFTHIFAFYFFSLSLLRM
jgi:hypothetical protein